MIIFNYGKNKIYKNISLLYTKWLEKYFASKNVFYNKEIIWNFMYKQQISQILYNMHK